MLLFYSVFPQLFQLESGIQGGAVSQLMLCAGRRALHSLPRGSRERGLHNHREGKLLCENHVLSWVHCDSHQNLCGDMSELLPLHLSSAAQITASSAPRSVVPGLSEGGHYIQVTPRTVMCVTEDLTCQTPRGCSCGQCYLLGFQLSFKCNLVIF